MSATAPPSSDAPPEQTLWLEQCDWRQIVEDLHLHYTPRPRKPGRPAGPGKSGRAGADPATMPRHGGATQR